MYQVREKWPKRHPNGHLEIHPVTGIAGLRNFQLLEDNRERQMLPKVLVLFLSGQFLLVFVFAPGAGFVHLRLVSFGFRFCALCLFPSSPASLVRFSFSRPVLVSFISGWLLAVRVFAPGVGFVHTRLVLVFFWHPGVSKDQNNWFWGLGTGPQIPKS